MINLIEIRIFSISVYSTNNLQFFTFFKNCFFYSCYDLRLSVANIYFHCFLNQQRNPIGNFNGRRSFNPISGQRDRTRLYQSHSKPNQIRCKPSGVIPPHESVDPRPPGADPKTPHLTSRPIDLLELGEVDYHRGWENNRNMFGLCQLLNFCFCRIYKNYIDGH